MEAQAGVGWWLGEDRVHGSPKSQPTGGSSDGGEEEYQKAA